MQFTREEEPSKPEERKSYTNQRGLVFGEDEAREAHDHEQEVENLIMTADDVLDVEAADEEQQDILASTKDD